MWADGRVEIATAPCSDSAPSRVIMRTTLNDLLNLESE